MEDFWGDVIDQFVEGEDCPFQLSLEQYIYIFTFFHEDASKGMEIDRQTLESSCGVGLLGEENLVG